MSPRLQIHSTLGIYLLATPLHPGKQYSELFCNPLLEKTAKGETWERKKGEKDDLAPGSNQDPLRLSAPENKLPLKGSSGWLLLIHIIFLDLSFPDAHPW